MLEKFEKFQIHIDTARTIDTPYGRKNKNINIVDMKNRDDYQNSNKEVIKRKNFLVNQNSLTVQKKNKLQISHQLNHSNTLNVSKQKSFARQEQHSKNFVKNSDRSIRNQNSQQQSCNKNSNNQLKNAKSLEQYNKRSLSKKTEKIKFAKVNAYLQEVKSRKILDSLESGNQFSINDYTQRVNNKDQQPELNVEVCERYCAINTSLSLNNLNRYHKIGDMNLQNVKETTKLSQQLFPKSKKYKEQQEHRENEQVRLNSDYYTNRLPINGKTLLMSKKYNFRLKDSSNTNPKKQNKESFQRQIKENRLKYSLVQSFYRSNSKINRQDILSRLTSLRKTENLEANLNKSAFFQGKNNSKKQNYRTQNSLQDDYTLIQNVPENILIQQEDLRQQIFQKKDLNFEEYGFDVQGLVKTYKVSKTTKTFICKYCLEIFNILQITYHKGKVCNIVHKQSQFVQKIKKLSQFLNQTYEIYYQRRPLYSCFHDLAKKIDIKLEVLTNQQKFQAMALKLRSIFRLKQNYYRSQSLILKEKDRIFIDKIEEYLHLDEFIKLQEVFQAVDKIISLGKQNQNDFEKGKVPVHRPKVFLTKDIFWLVKKLFQGLILQKIKQIEI